MSCLAVPQVHREPLPTPGTACQCLPLLGLMASIPPPPPQIPPLGKHYSQRWAQEDLLEEQKDGARAAAVADKKKGLMGPLTELDTKGRPLASLPTPGQALASRKNSAPPSTASVCFRCGRPAEEV